MAIDFMASVGGSGNEYQDAAESAMLKAKAKDKAIAGAAAGAAGGGSFIGNLLSLIGINHDVGKVAKQGKSTDTGDLASAPKSPDSEKVAVMDKKGNVVDVVNHALATTDPSVQVKPLAMAPMELSPLSGQGLPRALQAIDPNTGRPWGT